MTKNILIVGCGDVGSQTGMQLMLKGHRVFAITRSSNKVLPFPHFNADVSDIESLRSCVEKIPADIHYIVYAVAPSARTPEAYQAVYPSGVSNLLQTINQQQLKGFLLVTSTGVYHQQQGEWVDENSATQPTQFSGCALLEAEQLLLDSAVKGVAVRFGGIYGPGRERLLNKLRAGCEINSTLPVYTNRIHRDDCAGMLCFLIEKIEAGVEVESCYIGVDNFPATEQEVLFSLATMLGVELPIDNPEMTISRQNKRCRNNRIRTLGYSFIFDDFETGYRKLIDSM